MTEDYAKVALLKFSMWIPPTSHLVSIGARPLLVPVTNTVQPTACDDLHHCRTIWNILWSCIITISACTWVTVHPNVPAWDESPFTIAWRRLKIVSLALVMPEFIVMWAVRQWLVARELGREVRESLDGKNYTTKDGKVREWTMTHGLFASMGGFVLSYDDRLHHPLNPSFMLGLDAPHSVIPYLIKNDYIDFNIIETEISDKSKGDMLSKGLIILQTTWFALQCIARGVQHLPTTELEFMTLAFVSLNLLTYILWWNKPLNVQCAIPVVLKRTIDDSDRRLKRYVRVDGGKNSADECKAGEPDRIVGRMLGTVQCYMQVIGAFATGTQDDHVDLTLAKRVPIFFAGVLTSYEDDRNANIVLAVVGAIFGAIHCIAWSSSFPSRMEQTLWRASCVAIVSAPGLYFAIYAGAALFMEAYQLQRSLRPLLKVILPPSLFIYLVGRITLFVLAFAALRSPPPGAFYTARWTSFIPHI